jgi:hypothetical protein
MKIENIYSKGTNSSIHPFPINLYLTVLKKIQGVVLYLLIRDHAAHLHFTRGETAWSELMKRFNSIGVTQQIVDENWGNFTKYIESIPDPLLIQLIFQAESLIDCFLIELQGFITCAVDQESLEISKFDLKNLTRFNSIDIKVAYDFLQRFCECQKIADVDLENFNELRYVRNLGIHQDWIIDEKYADKTQHKKLGEKRNVELSEFLIWYESAIRILDGFSKATAKRFANISY